MLHQLLFKVYGVLFHTLKCISHTDFPSFAIEKLSPHYAIFPFGYNFFCSHLSVTFPFWMRQLGKTKKKIPQLIFLNKEYLRSIVLLGHKPKYGYCH